MLRRRSGSPGSVAAAHASQRHAAAGPPPQAGSQDSQCLGRTQDSGRPTAPASAQRAARRASKGVAVAMLLAAISLASALPLAAAQASATQPRRAATPEEAPLTAAPSLQTPPPDLNAEAAAELKQVVRNNGPAAIRWFTSPNFTNEQGDTTIARAMVRVWGPQAVARCAEANQIIIRTAKEALLALPIKFESRYVVEQYTRGGVTGFPRAKEFEGFDLFFGVSTKPGVVLQTPLTPDIIQLANAYILAQLQTAQLATGIVLLGAVVPDSTWGMSKVAPSIVFDSVLKVTTSQPDKALPFVVERQTLLLSVLHGRKLATSPITSINITDPWTSRMTSDFPSARKLLAEQTDIYIGLDMLVVPTGLTPKGVFDYLLGDGTCHQQLADAGLPIQLQWWNSTVTTIERTPEGQVKLLTTVYPEPEGSSSLGDAAIAGIVISATVAAFVCLTGFYVLARWRLARPAQQRQPGQHGSHNELKDGSTHMQPGLPSVSESGASVASPKLDSASSLHMLRSKGQAPSSVSGSVPALPLIESSISPEEIEICLREDGSKWLLGSGSFEIGKQHGVHDVAVKKLRQANDNAQWFSHLQHEINMLSTVSRNRNVVQYYGACLDQNSPDTAMLVMEHCEGGDLRRAMNSDEEGKYTWAVNGKRIALDIARGLHSLHSKGVVHRDLKTSNILLTREGVAKISDVGLATAMTAAEPGSWDRTTGTFCYAAPELILGVRTDDKVDVFSFGVVLWEICTHEMPIRGQLRDIEVPDEGPAVVSALIDECLQPNPAKRPTAAAICERIQAMPEPPKGVRRSRSAGPLAANLGLDNGQRRTSSERGGSARLAMVKSPGMVDSEALLRSLYSA